MAAKLGFTTELAYLATVERLGVPSAKISQIVALAVVGVPPSRYAQESELFALVSEVGRAMGQVSEVSALVSYVEGGREIFTSRAWGFTFDQHQFYVLHLGQIGTYVYDAMTKQWSNWFTQGFTTWNMEYGVEWKDGVFAGDNQLPTLWKMDPHSFLDDDFRPILRTVTGGIPMTGRATLKTGALIMAVSKQAGVDPDDDNYIKLSISDDNGKTFRYMPTRIANSDELQDISWRSLGMIKAPGRVFKIEDQGALVRIDGADLKTKDDE